MAKPLKKSDQDKPWSPKNRAPSRKAATKSQREYFLIVCEGEKTEPNYFEALKNRLPRKTVAVEISGEGANTLSLVDRAISIREKIERCSGIPIDYTWAVFDRDSFPSDAFDNAINKGNAHNIDASWSNEAFELWYLLHFQERTTAMNRDEYESVLTKHLGEQYLKNDAHMYKKLKEKGDQGAAINRAKRLRKQHTEVPPSRANPCTHVDRLVIQLNRHLKDSEK
jgi:hypothetical protein